MQVNIFDLRYSLETSQYHFEAISHIHVVNEENICDVIMRCSLACS